MFFLPLQVHREAADERESFLAKTEGKKENASRQRKKERSRELMVVPVVCTVDGENQRMGAGN